MTKWNKFVDKEIVYVLVSIHPDQNSKADKWIDLQYRGKKSNI